MSTIQLPIEHISFSAMREYCSNRWAFKKHYILNDWTGSKNSIVGMAGKGFHRVMENYLMGLPLDKSIEKGVQYVESVKDKDIDFGKTGSREEILKQMSAGVNFYLEALPPFGKVLTTEENITADFEFEGSPAPLPIKAITDVVSETDGELHIHDHKLITAFSDIEQEQPNFIMQAMFNFTTVHSKYKRPPKAMHFHEVKKSKNKDGSPQVQNYTIEFEKHPEYHHYFGRMYTGLLIELSNDTTQFLPNFGDYFSGKESWRDFTSEVMDFDLPKQVIHKVAYMDNVDTSRGEKSFVAPSHDDTPEGQIIAKMQEFGMPLEFVDAFHGANVTLYTFKPSRGVSMKKLSGFEDDAALALGVESVRIQAPIKGTKFVGFEVSNEKQQIVRFTKKLLVADTLQIPIGQDVFGKNVNFDLAKAPHLLVAGATGAGKSVFLSVLIKSLMGQNTPNDLGFVLIDPKKTEFNGFEDSLHLESGVLTEVSDIHTSLEWLVGEMEERYKLMQDAKVRNIDEYNKTNHLKRIVVVIDELADLLLNNEVYHTERVRSKTKGVGGTLLKQEIGTSQHSFAREIEQNIIRLAQKSRAAGIHMVIATQRPSTNVVTGILKANLPCRVAFRTATQVDSQVILDQPGAEKLIGNGDLLLMDPRKQSLIRTQGYYI